MKGVAPEVSADDAGRRNDEAVRRLREESRRRVEGGRRRRAFASWCAVATLASGISLTALNAHDAGLQRNKEQEQELAEQDTAEALRTKRVSDACVERDKALVASYVLMGRELRLAESEAEQAAARARAEARKATAINTAADQGCGLHVAMPSEILFP